MSPRPEGPADQKPACPKRALRRRGRLLIAGAAIAFIASAGAAAGAAVAEKPDGCTLNGVRLYGKVQVVEAFPDLKVQVVHAFPDLRVERVQVFPDKCGKWQFVEVFPDFKVQFVEALPDLRIQFVEVFPGVP